MFVRSIELVFSKLLTIKAIFIYSDGLIGNIVHSINTNSTIIFILTTFLPVASREKVSEVVEFRTFILNLYGKFRGKEFVRAFMGSSKQFVELGIRQTTAVLSNPDRKSSHGHE